MPSTSCAVGFQEATDFGCCSIPMENGRETPECTGRGNLYLRCRQAMGQAIPGDEEVGMKLKLRPEVQAFAEDMERTLRNNDYKSGWKRMMYCGLMTRLRQEVEELHGAIGLPCGECGHKEEYETSKKKTIREAADVANFAMMIAYRARKS